MQVERQGRFLLLGEDGEQHARPRRAGGMARWRCRVEAEIIGIGRAGEAAELVDAARRRCGDLLAALLAELEPRLGAAAIAMPQAVDRRAVLAMCRDLLERLAAVSRTPLPQALEYLVGDTARRHGRLRVGGAGSYLRTLENLLEQPRYLMMAVMATFVVIL